MHNKDYSHRNYNSNTHKITSYQTVAPPNVSCLQRLFLLGGRERCTHTATHCVEPGWKTTSLNTVGPARLLIAEPHLRRRCRC